VFNGVTMSCLVWGNYIASISWLPWLVGSVIVAWQQGGRWIAVASLVGALQILTATPELILMAWFFLGILWLTAAVSREIKPLRSFLRLACVLVLTSGLVMVQILPFFDLLAHSQRDRNFATTLWSAPGWGWANLFVPLFHCYRSPQGTWFQKGQEFIASYYLGTGVLVLGGAGILLARTRRNAVIASAILFFWIMAMGSNSILFVWLKRLIPLVGVARFPVKFALFPAFLLPLLAAAAIDRLRCSPDKKARWTVLSLTVAALLTTGIILGIARQYPLAGDQFNVTAANGIFRAGLMVIVIAGIFLLGWIKSRPTQIALQAILLATLPIDALTHSPKIAPTLPASVLAPGMWQAKGHSPVVLGQSRIMVSPEAEKFLNYSRVDDLKIDFIIKRVAEWYNLNLLDGIPKVTGAMTLRPAHFDQVESYLYSVPNSHAGEGLKDFLSVAWISAANPIQWEARTNYLPLLSAGQRPVFGDEGKTFTAIMSDVFDPRREVFLPESARPFVTGSNQTSCEIGEIQVTPQMINATVNTATPSLVVLSQTFYHHWRASVDGQPAKILRANLAFQAVQIPAGRHQLKLVYHDPNLLPGAILSIVALTACAVIWFRRKSGATLTD
ncbi:MAG: YfhO family protein, partial [Verrucomicrobiota bacterium]